MTDNAHEISLHAYVERILAEHVRWADEKFSALDRALIIARDQDGKKFEQLNELRREVTTDRSLFVVRETYDIWRDTLMKELSNVEQRLSVVETRVNVWAAVLAVFMVIVQIVSHFLWRG